MAFPPLPEAISKVPQDFLEQELMVIGYPVHGVRVCKNFELKVLVKPRGGTETKKKVIKDSVCVVELIPEQIPMLHWTPVPVSETFSSSKAKHTTGGRWEFTVELETQPGASGAYYCRAVLGSNDGVHLNCRLEDMAVSPRFMVRD